jgi:Ras-related protein Rab-5C
MKPFKITILGDSDVGKSAITRRLYIDNFSDVQDSTIGAAFYRKNYNGSQYNFWDTAGQERYQALTPFYYRDASIVVLVFDVTKLETVERVKYYLYKLDDEIKNEYHTIILGNKYDLVDGYDINFKKIKKDLEKIKTHNTDFMIVSAKTNYNIKELMNMIDTRCKEIKKIDDKLQLEDIKKNTRYYGCPCR